MKPLELDREKLEEIIKDHADEKWALIPLLQKIQEEFGYIPPESIHPVAKALKLYASEVQGVIEFYSGFSLKPRGRHIFKVCCGTACHVKGGRNVLDAMKKELGIAEGETSPDYQHSLETVACLGACFLAPAMMANKDYFGKLNPGKVGSIVSQYNSKEKEDRNNE